MTFGEMVLKALEQIDGWDDLDDKQKHLCVCFAAIQIANLTFNWISEHKEEIKSWLK